MKCAVSSHPYPSQSPVTELEDREEADQSVLTPVLLQKRLYWDPDWAALPGLPRPACELCFRLSQ